MNKKQYMNPDMEVIKIELTQTLAVSGPTTGIDPNQSENAENADSPLFNLGW